MEKLNEIVLSKELKTNNVLYILYLTKTENEYIPQLPKLDFFIDKKKMIDHYKSSESKVISTM